MQAMESHDTNKGKGLLAHLFPWRAAHAPAHPQPAGHAHHQAQHIDHPQPMPNPAPPHRPAAATHRPHAPAAPQPTNQHPTDARRQPNAAVPYHRFQANASRQHIAVPKSPAARRVVSEASKSMRDPFVPTPVVEPKSVDIRVPIVESQLPCFTIHMKHTGKQRLAFKVKGTKLHCFKVSPIYGSLLPDTETAVTVWARDYVMHDDEEYSKFDHFSVVMAPLPINMPPSLPFKKLWEMKPTPIKIFPIKIRWIEEKILTESYSMSDDGKSATLDGPSSTDPSVKPEVLKVHVPSDEENRSRHTLTLRNNYEDKTLAFKVKSTQIKRFKLHPVMDVLEAGEECKVSFVPINFDEHDEEGFNPYDHLTLQFVETEASVSDGDSVAHARDVWKDKPEPLHSVTVPIQYYMNAKHKSIFHHMKIVRSPTGFHLVPQHQYTNL